MKILSLAFDDFHASAVDWVMESQTRGIMPVCTFFACGGYADQPEYYSVEDLKGLRQAGHEIACHTFSHWRLSEVGISDYIADIDRNADFFRSVGIDSVSSFAFPYNESTHPAIKNLAQRFRIVRGAALNRANISCTRHPVCIKLYESLLTKRALSNHFETAGEGCWLLMYTHDVRSRPSKYGCSSDLLRHTLDLCSKHGFTVLPVLRAFMLQMDKKRG